MELLSLYWFRTFQPLINLPNYNRVTNSDNITEESGGRAHTWGQRNSEGTSTKLLFRGNDIDKWQAVQSSNLTQVLGIIKEKLNYPYTAVANITFSARSFKILRLELMTGVY